jgi:hypothetical protein
METVWRLGSHPACTTSGHAGQRRHAVGKIPMQQPDADVDQPTAMRVSSLRSPTSARRRAAIAPTRLPTITKASLCQGVPSVLFAACEVPFGRCVFSRESWPVAFLAAEYGRRLAAPPGRSSSLRCGRSTWTCGVAGGRVAAIEEWPALSRPRAGPGGGPPVTVVVW